MSACYPPTPLVRDYLLDDTLPPRIGFRFQRQIRRRSQCFPHSETISETNCRVFGSHELAVRKFACGISPAANAKTLRKQPDGRVLVTDGPYTETKEHMGGFWILEAADLDEAVAGAKKAAIACGVPGEVRELLFYPAPEQECGESN